MNADKIRDSIILSAIRGLLVPQDAGETSASSLMQDIEKTKADLVSTGKIKKTIKTAPFTDDDELFDIPKGWQWCRLGDLLSIVSDGTHKTPKYVDYGVPFLSVQNISSGHLDMSKAKYISEEEHRILIDRVRPQVGDILICRIGTLGKAIEVTWKFDFSIFVSLGLLRPIDSRLTPFIITVINSPWGRQWIDKVKVGGGTHTNKINLADIPSFPIPLPPLNEQIRIIKRIEELLPLIDEYDKAAVELNTLNELLPDKLRKSVLQEAIHGNLVPNDIPEGEATAQELLQQILKERQEKENKEKGKKAKKLSLSTIDEEPWELPEGWCWCKVGDIGSWGAGATPQRGKMEYYQGGTIPWLKTGELNNSVVYDTEEKVTPLDLEQCSLRLCQPNDVLIAMYGATIGKLAIAGVPLTTNQACCACTPYNGIFNKYLFFFLLAKKDDFTKQAFGGAQPNISKEKIVDTVFPLPPLSIQHRIVKKIDEVFSAINNLQA